MAAPCLCHNATDGAHGAFPRWVKPEQRMAPAELRTGSQQAASVAHTVDSRWRTERRRGWTINFVMSARNKVIIATQYRLFVHISVDEAATGFSHTGLAVNVAREIDNGAI